MKYDNDYDISTSYPIGMYWIVWHLIHMFVGHRLFGWLMSRFHIFLLCRISPSFFFPCDTMIWNKKQRVPPNCKTIPTWWPKNWIMNHNPKPTKRQNFNPCVFIHPFPRIVDAYFHPETGLGFNMGRLHMRPGLEFSLVGFPWVPPFLLGPNLLQSLICVFFVVLYVHYNE
jgi:hypothetical protein